MSKTLCKKEVLLFLEKSGLIRRFHEKSIKTPEIHIVIDFDTIDMTA